MGSRPVLDGKPQKFLHWKGENLAEWPKALVIQQFPEALR
jgi:hypothetical protein